MILIAESRFYVSKMLFHMGNRGLNRRGTTWLGLSDADKAKAETVSGAVALMAEHPALIKRPVFEDGEVVMVGFDKTVQSALQG